MISLPLFVAGMDDLRLLMLSLKTRLCPACGKAKSLNRHSILYGNDPANAGGRLQRGQRVFCCNRGNRGGCGRTFPVFFNAILPRHSVTAGILWALFCLLLNGFSIKAAAEATQSPFALETLYHLVTRLRRRIDAIRSLLHCQKPPPKSPRSSPLLHTIEHLQTVFPLTDCCPLQAFQSFFQRKLMG